MNKDILPILVIDNNKAFYSSYEAAIKKNGIQNYKISNSLRESYELLLKNEISVVVLNHNFLQDSCMDFLLKIKDVNAQIPIIVVSNDNNVETAVSCMKAGAFNYLAGIDRSDLFNSIKNALDINPVQLSEVNEQKIDITSGKNKIKDEGLKHADVFSKIITENETMKAVFRYIEAIAATSKAVLITGESGTGKELIAKSIHEISRNDKNFVGINVAGLDDNMFSDTLFGHKKGSFTGADENRKGLIEQAFQGTLFLDEIGDLESTSQVKLLRLLQEEEYYPIGADVPVKSDVRVLASTNADLEFKQENGSFRTDLYYRLNAHHIQLPPLRERLDDLPLLVEHFAELSAESLNRAVPKIPKQIYTVLRRYYFRGNIRELESMVFDAVSRNIGDVLSIDYFNEYVKKNSRKSNRGTASYIGGDSLVTYSGRFPTLEEVEDYFITEALKRAKGNQSIAAQLLGVNQSTLSRRLKKKFQI